MTKNYKILAEFIKDMSCETQDVETSEMFRVEILSLRLHPQGGGHRLPMVEAYGRQ